MEIVKDEELLEAIDEDKKKQVANLMQHLTTLFAEMEMINVKVVSNPDLKHKTLIHEMKRYMELSQTVAYIKMVGTSWYSVDLEATLLKTLGNRKKSADILIPEVMDGQTPL